mgnify:CR=1 FL=1
MQMKECRSCGSKKLSDILSLGNQYLSEFRSDDKKPEQHPLELVLCEGCSLLQLKHTTPSSLLYTDNYGYRSGINQTMRDHLKEIASKADDSVLPIPDEIVVDIGCNDGTLLKSYDFTQGIKRVGFDPVGKFAKDLDGTDILFVNDYFNKKIFQDHFGEEKAVIITAISMFYDLDDPNTFVPDLASILDENGVIVVQQNYVVGMLLQNAFDNMVHEHLEYYSLLSLENLLRRHGLIVFDVELNDLNGGSFRTYICHKDAREISNAVLQLRDSEVKLGLNKKDIYQNFSQRIALIKKKLNGFIKEKVQEGKIVYLYGASTRGNTLLQYCELDNSLIKAAVERNSEKWGTKIASVGIPIISEDQGRKDKPDYMLILPWFFAQGMKSEFVQREEEYLDNGGIFILPLPMPKLLTKDGIIDI